VADGGDELVLETVQGKALADVAEAEHGAGKAALVEDGGQGILGWEGAAVGAEDGIFARSGHVISVGMAKRTILSAFGDGGREAME